MAKPSRKANTLRALGVTLLVSGCLWGNPAMSAEPERYYLSHGKKIELRLADHLTALVFADDIKANHLLDSGMGSARSLGFEVEKTMAASHEIIVRGNPASVRSRLASRSDLNQQIVSTRPVFLIDGIDHPKKIVTIPDQMVVALNDSVDIDSRAALFDRYQLNVVKHMWANVYTVSAPVPTEDYPQLAARIAEENPELVRYAQPSLTFTADLHRSDALVAPNDPLFGQLWHLENTERNTEFERGLQDEDMDGPRAWNLNTREDGRTGGFYGGANPVISVAVFDTGVELVHEDFKVNTSDPTNLLPGIPAGDARNKSVIDPRIGFDYVDEDPDPSPDVVTSDDAHGTAVAGLIASARNNGLGLTGGAPSARIYAARILAGDSSVTDADIAQAVTDAAEAQVDLGNHSWGGEVASDVIEDAFIFAIESGRFGKGMANFVSSGNEYTYIAYPAFHNSTFSVGGVADNGQHVTYASFGPRLDFVGPTYETPPFILARVDDGFTTFLEVIYGGPDPWAGMDLNRTGITTTDLSGPAGYSQPNEFDTVDPLGNYADKFSFDAGEEQADDPFGGTSAACPIVVGGAAMVLANDPSLTATGLFNLLVKTADRPPDPFAYFAQTDTKDTAPIRPNWFRDRDGFNIYMGYGRPNPFSAIMNQYAPSPLRDDLGELEEVYKSDFNATVQAIQDCLRTVVDPKSGLKRTFFECALDPFTAASDWVFDYSDLFDPVLARARYGPINPGTTPENTHDLPYFVATQPENPEEYKPVLASEDPAEVLSTDYKFVIAQNRPTTNTVATDPFYDPDGRYLPNFIYKVKSKSGLSLGAAANSGRPLFLEITLRHELAIQNVSADPQFLLGSYLQYPEYDVFRVTCNGVTNNIIGDTAQSPPLRFPEPNFEDPDQDEGEFASQVAVWNTNFDVTRGRRTSTNKVRTYRFPVGFAQGTSVSMSFEMETGSSYLPQFDFEVDQFPRPQVKKVRRDQAGFEVLEVRLLAGEFLAQRFTPAPRPRRFASRGTRPIYSNSDKELYFVGDNQRTVRSVYSDEIYRFTNAGGSVVTDRRDSFALFTVFEPQILSLDSNPKSNELLYVVDGPSDTGRMFIVRDDGFAEKRITTNDTGIIAAEFATESDSIVMTDGTNLNSINTDGTFAASILRGSDVGLSSINSIEVDPSDAAVYFCAADTTGEVDLWTTVRVGNDPGDIIIPPRRILNWPGSIEKQIEMDAAGNRMAIVSNRLSLLDATPPSPTDPYRIYLMDNLQDVLLLGAAPVFTELPLDRDNGAPLSGGPATYLHAQFPSWHIDTYQGNQLVAFVGFTGSESAGDIAAGVGEIASVEAPPRATGGVPATPTPFPNPTVTPQPTATPDGADPVVLAGRYTFDAFGDGWEYGGVPAFHLEPNHSQNGSLLMTANGDSTNTFGFFDSPEAALQVFPISEPVPPFANDTRVGPHYIFRAYMRRTSTAPGGGSIANPSTAPTFRLRLNSRDFQNFGLLVANSLGSNPFIPPPSSPMAVDYFFHPQIKIFDLDQSLQNFSLAYDLLNVQPADDPFGGYFVDRVDIFRVPPKNIVKVADVALFTFLNQAERDQWETGGAPGFFEFPDFPSGNGYLGMSVKVPGDTFGNWSSKPGAITVNPGGAGGQLFVRMRSIVSANASNPLNVPDLRVRLSMQDFSAVSLEGGVPFGNGRILPKAGEPRTFYTYLPIPASQTTPFGIIASFDALSVGPRSTTTDVVAINEARIELVRVDNYPAVE